MATKVLDRYGRPHKTREVRRRLGFLGGDELDADCGEPVTFSQPSGVDGTATRATGDGENDDVVASGEPAGPLR